MTTQDIEQAIRGLIERIYCAQYKGILRVYEIVSTYPEESVVGYRMSLGLNKDERPLSIAGEGSAEEFIKLIEKELKERSLIRTEYFTAIQLYNTDECKTK